MKRPVLILAVLAMACSTAVASAKVEMSVEYVTPAPTPYIEGTSPGGYLWDVSIGTPMSDAKESFESVFKTRIADDGKGKYTAEDILIKGFYFDFTLSEDDSGCFKALNLISQNDYPFSLSSAFDRSSLSYAQCNAIFEMLVQKFGSPITSYWTFGAKYPLFDIPFSDGSIDFEFILKESAKRNSSIHLLWDHLSLDFGFRDVPSGGFRLTCTIIEKGVLPSTVETLGKYSEEALVMNSGITSF